MFCCTVWEYSENGKKSNFCLLKVAIVGFAFASPSKILGDASPRPPYNRRPCCRLKLLFAGHFNMNLTGGAAVRQMNGGL